MSTENIVNRTQSTPHLRYEIEKLNQIQPPWRQVIEQAQAAPVTQAPVTQPSTAEGQRASLVGSTDYSGFDLDGPEHKQAWKEVTGAMAGELLKAALSHAPRDPDLREFKDQVIKAFKHMGLDTRKFFS